MKRPWNIIDGLVYSLSTHADDKVNMNLVTYVTAVSRQPKIYVVSIFHNTKTLENLQGSGKAILQFLTTGHLNIARILGKRSGTTYDKEAYLRKKDLISEWKGLEVLSGCAAYISLNVHSVQTTGDHDPYLFHVDSYETGLDYHSLLTVDHLRASRMISI
jgi:flavin reductase (DIM6/NTAB) family NADH-FMN oxidoreductase RutF